MGEIVNIQEYRADKEIKGMTKLEHEARIEYLEGYLAAYHKMRSADLKLEELELDYGPSIPRLSGASGGKVGDGSDRILRRMEDKERFAAEHCRSRLEALRELRAIEKVIDRVSPKLQNALRYRYINDMDIEQIAIELKYSYRQVQRHIQQGIERIRPPRYKIDRIKRELLREHPEWALIEIKAA